MENPSKVVMSPDSVRSRGLFFTQFLTEELSVSQTTILFLHGLKARGLGKPIYNST